MRYYGNLHDVGVVHLSCIRRDIGKWVAVASEPQQVGNSSSSFDLHGSRVRKKWHESWRTQSSDTMGGIRGTHGASAPDEFEHS